MGTHIRIGGVASLIIQVVKKIVWTCLKVHIQSSECHIQIGGINGTMNHALLNSKL
jgi:hypothetical protein